MNKLGRLPIVLLTSALLAACGGGHSDDSSPPATGPGPTEVVSPGASESVVGLVSYLTALTHASADDKEPVDLSAFKPKTPDDTEPEAVN